VIFPSHIEFASDYLRFGVWWFDVGKKEMRVEEKTGG